MNSIVDYMDQDTNQIIEIVNKYIINDMKRVFGEKFTEKTFTDSLVYNVRDTVYTTIITLVPNFLGLSNELQKDVIKEVMFSVIKLTHKLGEIKVFELIEKEIDDEE